MRTAIEEYIRAFSAGCIAPGVAQNLRGRILHGRRDHPEDFLTLTDRPDERTRVMVFGQDGLEALIGQDHYQMLLKVACYKDEYIERLVANGQIFKLVLFNAEDNPAPLAIWETVVQLVASDFPRVAEKLFAARAALQSTSFAALQAQAKFNFEDADQRDNENFMTADRLRERAGLPWEVRAFLYFILHLRELFSGDGFTYTKEGVRVVMEYMAPNKPLSELGDIGILDLNVVVPV